MGARATSSAAAAPTWLVEVPLAHRGLHDDATPENTLDAFAAARTAGVGVELDVQRSADGVAVVVHDPDLERTAGRTGLVAGHSAEDLGSFGIPTLAAALDVLGDTPTLVEVKNHGSRITLLEPQVAGLLATVPGVRAVASFNPRTLAWFRRQAPEVPRVLTAGPLDDVPMPAPVRWSLRTLRWFARVGACAISYDVAGIDDPAVQARRSLGIPVLAWTVTTEDELRRARAHADNVIFEGLAVSTVLRTEG